MEGKEKENIQPPIESPAAPSVPDAALSDAVAQSWLKMNEVAGSFGVDLSTTESAQRAKQASDAGIHRLFVAPIVGHLDKFLVPELTPKLYPGKFLLVRHALAAGRDMLARAVDAPGQNLCRMIFKRFIQHVTLVPSTTGVTETSTLMLHEIVRVTAPQDAGEVLADIYTGPIPGLDRDLFVRWFQHLNPANRVNVYNTYLLIANGIVQVQPPYIGITDKIVEVVRLVRNEGHQFEIDRMLPMLETILGMFLGILAK